MKTVTGDKIVEAMRSPVVATAVEYAERLGSSVGRYAIRYEFLARPKFPALGLADIVDVFTKLGIETVALRASMSKPLTVPLPAIAFLDEGRGSEGVFVLLEELSAEARYIHPLIGGVAEPAERFRSRWSGILVYAAPQAEDLRVTGGPHEGEDARRYRDRVNLRRRFLDRRACEAVIRLAEQTGFSRSKVLPAAGSGVSAGVLEGTRTSESVSLGERTHPIVAAILSRVSDEAGVDSSYVENPQCVRYRAGQEFRPHFDADEDVRRVRTWLIYLNDDFDGGETWFPEIGYSVRPQQGACLSFPNICGNGGLIPESYHSAAPVTRGTKYACNVWVRDAPVVA